MLRAFATNTEYIPQCRAILDGSSNPYAQHFAAASLIKLLTENSGLSPQVRPSLQPARTPPHGSRAAQLRLDMRNYTLNLLATRGLGLESFVVTGACSSQCPPRRASHASAQRSSCFWCAPPRLGGSSWRRSSRW